jgi:antitoxin MazE
MQIVVKKWGNSLGIIIPSVIAKDLKLKDGTTVNVAERNGDIVISPNKLNLSALISKINEKNLHSETEFGQTEGKEVW